MSESFAELFEESVANTQLHPGAIVIGTVLDITSDAVVVNAGQNPKALSPKPVLDADGELEVAIGDQVEVALDAVEDGFGATRLSAKRRSVNSLGPSSTRRSNHKILLLDASMVRLKVVSL